MHDIAKALLVCNRLFLFHAMFLNLDLGFLYGKCGWICVITKAFYIGNNNLSNIWGSFFLIRVIGMNISYSDINY